MEKDLAIAHKTKVVRFVQRGDIRLQAVDSIWMCGEIRCIRSIVLGKTHEFF
jgi:hypothetical protein